MNRAKCFAIWVAVLAPFSPANAQSTPRDEPKIPSSGSKIESFIPRDYKIETRIDRDFDGDGRTDAALLIVPQCDGLSDPREDATCMAEGRILVVVLRDSQGRYRLSVRKPVSSDVGPHGDSFGGMTAHGRTLRFRGARASCAGQSGETYESSYRYQSGDWVLIGADNATWTRSTECGGDPIGSTLCPKLELRAGEECIQLDTSFNYNTSVQQLTWTIRTTIDDERTVVVRERFPRAPLRRLVDERLEF